MKRLLGYIKKFILYAECEKEVFRQYFFCEDVKKQIRDENRKSMSVITIVAMVLFGGVFAFSLLSEDFAPYRALYAVTLAFTLLAALINRFLVDRLKIDVRILVYPFVFAMLFVAILLGTVFAPHELAAAFLVMLIAAPLVFVDRPIRFVPLIFLSDIIFSVLVVLFKDEACRTTDLVNGTAFSIFAAICCIYSMNVKLRKYFLEVDILVASETDFLTGLKNRNAFEVAVSQYDPELLNDTFFLYADVNGLHEMNDRKGHAAGDSMLQCVGKIISEQFGENTYRIGGDEFVSFGSRDCFPDIEKMIENTTKKVNEAGYSVSIGYEWGIGAHSIGELLQKAEKRMYSDKAAFYNSMEHNRRSR